MNLNDLRLRVCAVLVLVLVTTLVFAAKGPVELDAQVTSTIPSDRQILISNLQGSSAGTDALLLVSAASSAVEIFAGVDPDGLDDTSKWMLESVVLRFDAPASGITVSLWSTDESGTVNVPNAQLTTFTTPTIPSGSMNSYLRFTLSTPYELDQDTGYWIVVNATSRTANSPYIATTTNQDSGGANSWDIGDPLIFRSTSTSAWQAHPTSFGLQVQAEGHFAPGVVILGDGDIFDDHDDQDDLSVGVAEDVNDPGEDVDFEYSVKLRSPPTGDVTVTPNAPAELMITPSSRTFTTTNWSTPQSFLVNPLEDDDLLDNTYTVTHSVSGYGSVTSGPSIEVEVKDNSQASITLSPSTLAVNEGAMDTYSFVLDKQPQFDVTITPTVPASSNVTVSPSSLTFTSSNWNVAQEFTVTAPEDANSTNETVTITHAVTEPGYSGNFTQDLGLTYHQIEEGTDRHGNEIDLDMVVTINDNDIITLNKSSLTVTEGGTGDYTVVLAQQPTATVTVTLTLSSGIGVTTMPSGTLTFTTTDWNAAQTVTVTGTQDADGFNNTGTITHTVSGGGLNGSARLDTTVTDDEEVGIVLAGSAMRNTADDGYEMTVTEGTSSGSSNQYTVKLASQPHPSTTDVTVDITASDSLKVKKTGEATGSAMATLTFTGTNWNTAQTVTLEAAQDADSADGEITISHVAKGANYQGHANNTENLDVTITDDDSPGIRPSVTTLAIAETNAAATGTFTVQLDTQPSADVTITLGQPTNTDVTVDTDTVTMDNQTDLTFTSTNWNVGQTVTVSVAHDASADNEVATITLNASQSGGDMEYNGVTERTVTVNVTDDETPFIRGISNSATFTENADGTVAGGGVQRFAVRLLSEPTSPVTITTTVVGVNPAVETGKAWTNPDIAATSSITVNSTNYTGIVPIVLTQTRDTDAEDDQVRIDYMVTQSGGAMEYDGYSIPSTTVNITDNEVAVVQFKASGETAWHAVNPNLTVTDAAGITIPTISTDLATLDVTASFDARLSHQPRGDVTVTMTTTTDQKTIFDTMTNTRGRPQTVAKTFAASSWSLTNTETFEVKVRADQDSYDESYMLDFSVSGYGEGTAADQTLRVVDQDPVGWASHTTTTFEVNEAEPNQIARWTVTPLSNPSRHDGRDANVEVELEYSIADKLRDGQSSFVLVSDDVWSDGLELSVRALHDADSANEEVTVRHVVTSQHGGMNGDYHSTSIQDIVITIIDDDPPDLRFGSLDTGNTLIATEPDMGTVRKEFSFLLATLPRDEVTVEVSQDIDNASISQGSRQTFNSSNNFGRFVRLEISPDNDTVDDTGEVMFTVTQPGGPMEYDGLMVTPIPITITDTDKSEAVLSVDTLNVTEESTGSYTVALSHQPAASDTLMVEIEITGPPGATLVTVDDDSLEFTASNWNTPQTVTITGDADANLVNETFTLTHKVTGTRASTETESLRVTRTDNDTANLDPSSSAVTSAEGSSDTFTVKLTQQPSADVIVTVTAQGSGHDVSVTSASDCNTTSSSVMFTFTSSNWDTAQTARVCAAHDYDAQDDMNTLQVAVSSSTDTNYAALSTRPITINVTVTDDDTESITFEKSSVTIDEMEGGVGTDSYNVSLTAAPTGGNVVVTIASSNTDVTTSPTSLTFRPSDWDSSIPLATPTVTKSVQIRVADDADANEDTAEITHSQSGASYGTVASLPGITVTITDTDMHGVTVAADDPFEFTEGGSKTYTLVLDSQPTGPVTIGIDDGDATDDVTVNMPTVEFDVDDWSTPKTVRVSAAADDDGSDDTATITHTVSGADYQTVGVTADSVAVTVLDPDVQAVILRVGGVEGPTDPAFAIGEGFGTVEYALKLATRPVGGDVTVTVTTTNTAELVIVDPGTGSNVTSRDVVFTASNWDDFQTVTVTAPQEDADTQTEIVMITHTVSGADYASVTADSIDVTINDDDDPGFSPAVESLDITEGTTSSYTVVLDNIPVGGNVTMTISAEGNPDLKLVDSDNNEVNQLTLTFTSTDFSTPQTVTVSAVEDNDALADTGTLRHSVTGANFGGIDDILVTVNIEDVTVAGVTIDPLSLSITEGRAGAYTVVLQSQPQANVTVAASSSSPGAATITPGSLTFTNSNWNQPQRIQVTGVRDGASTNRMSTISHTSSGDLYDDVEIASVAIAVIDDGTAIRDDSSFLQRSSCDGEVRLTWNSPTDDDVTVSSYRIQWRTADQQFSTARSVSAPADATSYTLTSLKNGVMYTIRVHGLDDMGAAVWSREATATPSTQSCIATVSFGNILADSTPVIVEVDEMAEGTMVNMRYRSLNPGQWSEVLSKLVERGETKVVFDIRGLRPDNRYEVQTWLGNVRPPIDDRSDTTTAIAQTIFETTPLPEGVTYVPGGGGGGSIARISRIEPAISGVTVSRGDRVALAVEVWGRQGIRDNGLADKAPADGRPEIVWSSSGSGSFEEAVNRREWRDGSANDRKVTFVAPDEPGPYTVTASLVESTDCLAQQEDEEPEEHTARCSAHFEITVVRRVTVPIIETAPVNPPGVIPETLTDEAGTAYAVFTPVEGGSFSGEGYSFTADAGAVPDGEFIGIAMSPLGDASNMGETWQRYTLSGRYFGISAVDATAESLSEYVLDEAAKVCIPLPPDLRSNIGDIVMVATTRDGQVQILSTSVKIASEDVSVCGALSSLPAEVAAGKDGSPPEADGPADLPTDDELSPDTGGVPIVPGIAMWMLLAGAAGMVAGMLLLLTTRRWSRRRSAQRGSA